MNMLEMAKLVGNQAIAKADEIATGKFAEEKVEEAAEGKAAKGKKGKKEKKESGGDDTEGGKLAKEVNVHEEGTGVTAEMKKSWRSSTTRSAWSSSRRRTSAPPSASSRRPWG